MKQTKWRFMAPILLWLCGMASCQQKAETLPVQAPVLPTSNIMMPLRSAGISDTESAADAVVFVCKSAGAKRYHYNQDCHGLKRCKHQIETLNVEAAENVGLTICKYEN